MSANNSKLTLVSPEAIAKAIGRDTQSKTRNAHGSIAFYAFNDETNHRFVIVSGDERQYETLGSSDNGTLNPEAIPCGLQTFLWLYADEYDYLQTSGEPSADTRTVSEVRKAYSSTSPLIKTKWDQDAPYNNQCPYVSGGKCITGCVATAMAQIMNYHQYPERGEGVVKRISGKNRLSSDALDLSTRSFDWNSLQYAEKIYTSSSSSTISAVAYLMKACGYAVKMDYGTIKQESGAYPSNIATALIGNFGYNEGVTMISKSEYRSTWESKIQEELSNRRPIIYCGYGSGGHCFILDGYQSSSGKYYFNWGWSGYNDGPFSLSSLRPGTSNFTDNQLMVYRIYPEADVNVEKPVITIDTDNEVATIICSTEGVKLYYSFTPQDQSSESSYSRYYGEKISINRNGTFRAYAELKSKKTYATAEKVSWYKVEKPEFYPDGNKLTIKCPSATTIYYTKDGKNPTISSTKYSSAITCSNGTTIKAIGVKANYTNSSIATYDYKENIKTVYNFTNTAGKISEKINNASKLKVISLTVSGKLNGTDIKYIRQMLEEGELSRLDLKNASIVSGGDGYYGSSSLTSDNVIGDYMFWKSPKLTSIVLPSNITEIGGHAFQECPLLTKLEIPASCTTIGTRAFCESGLTSLTIPMSVNNISWGIIQGCKSLTSLSVDKANKYYDSRDNCNAIIETASDKLIAGCIRTVIPLNVKEIEMYGFCSSPSKLVIPGNVSSIWNWAFEDNTTLQEVTIDEGVRYISSFAFSKCSGLQTVIVPKSVWKISENSFEDCSSLRYFTTYAETPISINTNVFEGSNYKKATLRVPYGSRSKYQNATVWKDFKTIEEMDPVVNSIAELRALKDQYATLKLDGAQVTYAYNDVLDYAFIRDGSGAGYLFGSDFFTISGLNIKTGDILSGSIPVKLNSATGGIQFISHKFDPRKFAVTGNKTVVPKVVTADEVNNAENECDLVAVENVEMSGGVDYLYFSTQSQKYTWVSPVNGLEPDDYEAILAATKNIDLTGRKFDLVGIPQRQTSLYLTQPAKDVTSSGINSVIIYEERSGVVYDLQGRKVSGNLKSGIYIKNGKKVYIK